MELNFLSILACTFIVDTIFGNWISAGKSQSFMFETTKIISTQIRWVLQMEKTNATLFVCFTFPTLECYVSEDTFLEIYSANITSNSSSYNSVFEIKSVTPLQHQMIWFCFALSQQGFTASVKYDLNVFAVADIPICGDVTLINEINIQISCSTQKVFPGSICLFYNKINMSSENELNQGSPTYTHDQNVTSGYYKTKCTYIVSAAILGPGSHIFRVVMYPDIASNITEEIKTTSQYTSSITISYPKAVLGTDCFLNNYIKENETSTCTCYNNNTSFLPTQVMWSTGNTKDGILKFTARKPSHTGISFQCVVSNSLNFTNVITYQPRVAYPPDLSLTLDNAEWDLCLHKTIDIKGSCSVNDGYPASLVSIYINNVLLHASHVSVMLEYNFNTSYTSSGVVNVTCLAYNVAFSVSAAKYLTIKGPPERPNIFELVKKVTNFSSNESQLAIIMCQSRGGFPSFKQLSLTCDAMETQATNVDTVTLEIKMTRTPTDVNCTCVVWHESNCLQNKSTESLRLFLSENSRTAEINSAAIVVGVTLGLGLLVSISVNIVVIKRHKGIKREDVLTKSSNPKKMQEYNDVGATPYVNTELHSYETANIRPSYSNEVAPSSLSQHVVKRNISIQNADKEEHPYDEVTELK